MKSSFFKIGLLSAMVSVLVACGGGGAGSNASSTPTPPPSLSGIAAIGAAMAGAKVTLKDSNGKSASTTADDNGNFSFSNINGFTPPIMLRATTSTHTMHSLLTSVPSTGNIHLNVTPATEVLTAQTLGNSPASAFDSSGFKGAEPAKLTAAKAKLMAALEDTLLAMGLNLDAVDVMSTKFAADQTGLDKLLDLVEFSAIQNGEMKLKDKKSDKSVTIKANEDSVSKIDVTIDGVTSLNTNGIGTLIEKLITAGNNNKQLDPTDFHQDFLFQGSDQTNFQDILSDTSATASDDFTIDSKYKIKKCIQKDKVCYVGMRVKTKTRDITLMNLDMGVKQDANGTWKLYGDQAPFVFSYRPLFIYLESASGTGIAKNGYLVNAVAPNFTGKACNSCENSIYKSATVEVIYADKRYATPPFSIRATEVNYASNDSSSLNNLIRFSPADAQKFNEESASGNVKIRITAVDDKNIKKSWELPTLPLLFSSHAEVKDYMKENNWGIGAGLESSSVAFTGNKIMEFIVDLKQPSSNYLSTFTYDSTLFKSGLFTPLNNDNSCSSLRNYYYYRSMSCDDFFKNSKVSSFSMASTDDKGRVVVYGKLP